MRAPEFRAKLEEGPVAWLIVRPNGAPNMGLSLALWFVFNLAIAFVAAYLACRLLPATATGMQIARVVFTVSFLAYVGGSVSSGIWMGKPWKTVAKDAIDGLVYGVLSALAFAWLWPR